MELTRRRLTRRLSQRGGAAAVGGWTVSGDGGSAWSRWRHPHVTRNSVAHTKSMKGTRWVVIDTETDGLYEPIHVVELAGQLMEGWERVGDPFRMLLNHDVPIPPEAVAIHGYTQEHLRRHGQAPSHVHAAFRDYARDYPLVAHNLSYDWNRCLEPEWARLGVPQIGQRGFCCMMLARRLVPETSSYRLEALKQCFQLTPSWSHQAENDVLTVETSGGKTMEFYGSREQVSRAGKGFEAVKRTSFTKVVPQPISLINWDDYELPGSEKNGKHAEKNGKHKGGGLFD